MNSPARFSPARLRHNAFVYESDEEYVETSVAFLRDGLDAGEACAVAQTRNGISQMREALGADADRVTFFDVSSVYTRPARAVAQYYGTFLTLLREAPSVRAVAEGQFGFTPEDLREWTAYESITNVAYSHLPVWVVCTYDARRVPDALLQAMWETHSDVFTDKWEASDHFEDPRELVSRLTPTPEPLALRAHSLGDEESFRESLARELGAENVPRATAMDALVAGSEIAANAVRHGGGIEEVRMGGADGRFVCEVTDRGSGFDDPLAGYVAPREGIGTGLWVARQLTWRLETFHSPHGFTVRIWV
jgi:anti-sigma regulatory factor (Ser/Thr protein kinase)